MKKFDIAKLLLALLLILGTILICSAMVGTERRIKKLETTLNEIVENDDNIEKNIDALKDDYESIMDHIFSQPYGYYTEEEQKIIKNQIDNMGD